jgi:hypothetical protein
VAGTGDHDRVAIEDDLTFVWLDRTRDDFHQSRLAGTVLTAEREHATGRRRD